MTDDQMTRAAIGGAVLAICVAVAMASAAHAWNSPAANLFATPSGAQRHCPNDTVVWLNTRSGIYHLQGERWYGNTEQGAYVCEREANHAGDRETRNGQ